MFTNMFHIADRELINIKNKSIFDLAKKSRVKDSVVSYIIYFEN